MSNVDTHTKKYVGDPERFAELFNTFIFNGESVVDGKKLTPRDTTEIMMDIDKKITIQRARDCLKLLQMMTGPDANYLLLGIENQAGIHYAMPIKTMIYDAANYDAQVAAYSKIIKENSSDYSKNEYVSRFPRGAKLIPVITLVLYWGVEKWDAPKSLFEMFEPVIVEKYGKYIENYSLNVICINEISDSTINEFKTDLKQVFSYLKYRNDKNKLKEIVDAGEVFSSVDKETAELIKAVSGSKLKFKGKGEKIDMKDAIQQMCDEAVEEATIKFKEKERDYIKDVFVMISNEIPGLTKEEKLNKVASIFKVPVKEVKNIVEKTEIIHG